MVEVRHWYETKSSDEGQIIEALRGQSPLHKTKSSVEGQIIETLGGRSLLHVTKSSDEGHITRPSMVEVSWPLWLKSVARDKVLR